MAAANRLDFLSPESQKGLSCDKLKEAGKWKN
jgi:hypothetical protein